ncbi:MAG: LacI family DNA-binding transcriptional regulator [Mucilaginibacter sp.]
MISKPRVTLKLIADELGISQATVCRALRGDKAIKTSTRKKVREMANLLGYHFTQKIRREKITGVDPFYRKNLPQLETTIYDIAQLLNISPATVSRALNDSSQVKKETKLRVQAMASELNYNLNETAKALNKTKENGITIGDLAQKLNLSASTVSRGLNEKHCVSSQTKQLVKNEAAKVGFTATTAAANLKAKKMLTVGVIISDFSAPIALALQGIQSVVKRRKMNLVVLNSFAFQPVRTGLLHRLLNNADGILTIPGPFDNTGAVANILDYKNTPCICLGSNKDGYHHETISLDPYKSVYEIACYLISVGCRRLCIIDPTADFTSPTRIEAFRQAVCDNKLNPDCQLIISDSNNLFSSDLLVDRILSNRYLPDAIIMINCLFDKVSIKTLRNSGIAIDKGLVVCEFDMGLFEPDQLGKATYLTHDFYDLGVKGITKLLAKIDGICQENKPVFAKHEIHLNEIATIF